MHCVHVKTTVWCQSADLTLCVKDQPCALRCQHTKSSLMSVQSSGSLEGTPSLVPALHVPNTDCVFSNIPRQWWRPRKVSLNISRRICVFYQLVRLFCAERKEIVSKSPSKSWWRIQLVSLRYSNASAPKSIEPVWLASSIEDTDRLSVLRPVW